MKITENTFYDKIFVNEVGDSFIGGMCGHAARLGCRSSGPTGLHNKSKHNQQSGSVSEKDFIDVRRFNYLTVDSGKYRAFYESSTSVYRNKSTNNGIPLHQVQYHFKQDSLVIYESDYKNNCYENIGGNLYKSHWQYNLVMVTARK